MGSTEAIWRERVRRHRESGLTAREFAQQNGFHQTTLSRWKRVLATKAPSTSMTLARVRGSRSGGIVVSTRPASDATLELEVRGVTVRIRRGFDSELLRAVVAALAEAT